MPFRLLIPAFSQPAPQPAAKAAREPDRSPATHKNRPIAEEEFFRHDLRPEHLWGERSLDEILTGEVAPLWGMGMGVPET